MNFLKETRFNRFLNSLARADFKSLFQSNSFKGLWYPFIIAFTIIMVSHQLQMCTDDNSSRCRSNNLIVDGEPRVISVHCAKPFNILRVYGQPKAEVQKVLGPPGKRYKFSEHTYSYRGEGVIIRYKDGLADHISVFPGQLPFKVEDILLFLSLPAEELGPHTRNSSGRYQTLSWDSSRYKLFAQAKIGRMVGYLTFSTPAQNPGGE